MQFKATGKPTGLGINYLVTMTTCISHLTGLRLWPICNTGTVLTLPPALARVSTEMMNEQIVWEAENILPCPSIPQLSLVLDY